MSRKTVLIIDDEADLIELLRYNLERAGFETIAAMDGESGLEVALNHTPDVVVLDLMMPGLDGLDVCRRLRADARTSRLPVIMLTARAAEADRIVGLELGADDYVCKPFSPRELVARVKAVLRRAANPVDSEEVMHRGGLSVDVARREVLHEGRPIALTATEFRILQLLVTKPGRVLSRDEIIDAALDSDAAVLGRTVDVHITAIRRKLGKGTARIETVRGFGYRLADHADAEAVEQPC